MSPPSETLHNFYTNTQYIPEALKLTPEWMGTRVEPKADGGLNKPPYRVRDGMPIIKADKRKPKNRATFEEACAALERGQVDAIGFVFTAEDPFAVIDQDYVIDLETGEIETRAADIVSDFTTYWETSLSGTGLHGICIGTKPGERCKKDPVEIYDGRSGARFMVLTGNTVGGDGLGIRDCQRQIDDLYHKLFPKPSQRRQAASYEPLSMSDEELLNSARRARKTGAKFQMLYDRGDWSGYKSQSQADYALMNLLTYRFAGDRDRIIDAFKKSALYRPPPEKHRNYVEDSVNKLVDDYTGEFFQPRAVRDKPPEKQRDLLDPYLTELLDLAKWKGQKPSVAWKVYAHMIIQVAEMGVEASSGELVVGSDVRTIAEGAGVHRNTVAQSSLPYLVKTKRIKWRKGAGGRAGTFVLVPPQNSAVCDITVNTQEYFNGTNWGNGLDVLRKLIRMRSGSAVKGRARRIGKLERVARLGMVPMFCLVALTATPRVQTVEELVESTGRDKYSIRDAMEKLKGADIVVEARKDDYALAEGFWTAYDRELKRSLIVDAERRQRKQHQQERRDNEMRLKTGQANWRAKYDPKVLSLEAKRRKKLDREARLNQTVGTEHLTEARRLQIEEAELMRDYDRMVEKTIDRLGKRGLG